MSQPKFSRKQSTPKTHGMMENSALSMASVEALFTKLGGLDAYLKY